MQGHLKKQKVFLLLIPIIIIIIGLNIFSEKKGKIDQGFVMKKVMNSKLKDVAPIFSKEGIKVISQMQEYGLLVNSLDDSIVEIAHKNHKDPKELLHFFE